MRSAAALPLPVGFRRIVLTVCLAVLTPGLGAAALVHHNGRQTLDASTPHIARTLPLVTTIADLKGTIARQEPILYEHHATTDRERFLEAYGRNRARIEGALRSLNHEVQADAELAGIDAGDAWIVAIAAPGWASARWDHAVGGRVLAVGEHHVAECGFVHPCLSDVTEQRDADRLLQVAAGFPREAVGSFRLEGDTLVLLLTGPHLGALPAKPAGRAVKAAAAPMLVQGHELVVTVTICLGVAPHDPTTEIDLVRRADTALRAAKTRGGHGVQRYLPVIGLGQSLGLRVIAEGVETREQLDCLARHGCDELHGYLRSSPRPAHEISALLAQGWRLRAVSEACDAVSVAS